MSKSDYYQSEKFVEITRNEAGLVYDKYQSKWKKRRKEVKLFCVSYVNKEINNNPSNLEGISKKGYQFGGDWCII